METPKVLLLAVSSMCALCGTTSISTNAATEELNAAGRVYCLKLPGVNKSTTTLTLLE
jgi:hypothetical protein